MSDEGDMMNKELEVLSAIQESVVKFSESILNDLHADPNMLAGILASTALRLYKSSLSPEDYDSMIDMISETRDEVLPFNYIKAPEDLH